MYRKMLKSKIHRATVNEADLNYEGSITLPKALLKASNIFIHEAVHIWNVTAGTRFETYAIEGDTSSRICVNGAAAHLVTPGDILIIASFVIIEEASCATFTPSVIFVDAFNQIIEKRLESHPYQVNTQERG